MIKSKKSLLFFTSLLLISCILPAGRGATFGDSVINVDVGTVITLTCTQTQETGLPGGPKVGDKISTTINAVTNENNLVVVNGSFETYNSTTRTWSTSVNNVTILKYNSTTNYFNCSIDMGYAISYSEVIAPYPLNLTIVANFFDSEESTYVMNSTIYTLNFSSIIVGSVFNLTWNINVNHTKGGSFWRACTYNSLGILTQLEIECPGWFGPGYPPPGFDPTISTIYKVQYPPTPIPFGFSFIGITVISVITLVIIVKKRKLHVKL